MTKIKLLGWRVLLLLIALPTYAAAGFYGRAESIPPVIQQQMLHYTWHHGCPVPLQQLALLKLSYWGFDNRSHQGELIVNKALAAQTLEIFKMLYQHHYPIQRMELMYRFKGDDEKAMAVNDTSAFNCRPITGKVGVFSQHAYGRAIDINPLINPYIKGNIILPTNATKQSIQRQLPQPGLITHNSFIYKIFTAKGWHWGGDWHTLKDYQHFEKPEPIHENK